MSGAKIVLTMSLIKGILCSNMSSLDWYNCGEPDLTFGALSRRDIVYMNEHHWKTMGTAQKEKKVMNEKFRLSGIIAFMSDVFFCDFSKIVDT